MPASRPFSRFALLAMCLAGSAAWATVPAAAKELHLLASLAPGAANPNATLVPRPAVREAQRRCIQMYQPCGRTPSGCCPGLQCLPLSDTGYLCGPPPNR